MAHPLQRAVELRAHGRFGEAEQICDAVLAGNPRDFDALHLSGVLKHQQGRMADALRLIAAALEEQPGSVDALGNNGLILEALGRHQEALASFDRVLAQQAGNASLYRRRGDALQCLCRYEDALASYDKALKLSPNLGALHFSRGTTLAALDRHEEALASFDRVIALAAEAAGSPATAEADRRNAVAYYSRGTILIALERYDEACASFDEALTLRPDYAEALGNRGVALAELGRYDDALADYDAALRLAPDFADAHNNRGNAFLAANRMDEALRCYAAAITVDPDHADANFNAAVTRLCLGDFRGGWKQYRYRMNRKKNPVAQPSFNRPQWRGETDLDGKTVLLCAEQGLGDAIQFIRYAPMVAALGAKVLLQVHPALTTVMATVPGIVQVIGNGDALPAFDLYCPLLDLPAAFETETATIPARVPYIRPYGAYVEKWRDRLPDHGRLRVGICWAGSGAHVNNRRRSMTLERFTKILSVRDVDFVCLQKEVGADELTILYEHRVVPLGREFRDFADTAAVVAMLDLIITVDTSVAHLAGAMAKAVALLVPFSPDWRWMLDRTDSPWYPTLRLFRQTAIDDWNGPVEQVHRELADLARRATPGYSEAVTACG